MYGARKSPTLGVIRFVSPPQVAGPMEILAQLVLIYVAIGAVLFALIPGQAVPDDFHWRNQVGVFRDSLPEVLAWPLVLWRFCRNGR